MRTILLIILLLFLVVPARGELSQDAKPLVGLEGIVVLTAVNDGADDAGISADTMKTATELSLRRNGIAIVDNAAPPAQRAVLQARIMAQQIPWEKQKYVFALTLTVVQPVLLVRNRDIVTLSPTWDRGSTVGFGGKAEMREALDNGLDQLANDWLAANPKEKGEKKP